MNSYQHNPYRHSLPTNTSSQHPRLPPPPPPQLATSGEQGEAEEADDGDDGGGGGVVGPRQSAELSREAHAAPTNAATDALQNQQQRGTPVTVPVGSGRMSQRTRPTPQTSPYFTASASLSMTSLLERFPQSPRPSVADVRAGAETAHQQPEHSRRSSNASHRGSGRMPLRPSPSAATSAPLATTEPPRRGGGGRAVEGDVRSVAGDPPSYAPQSSGGSSSRSWPQLALPPVAHSHGTPPSVSAPLPPSLAACAAAAAAVQSTVEALAMTLFVDGLPAAIENQWQLRPYIPPQGLTFLRVKSSRGRNVGFAVYEGLGTARDAHAWFKHMRIIQEVVVSSTYGDALATATGTSVVGADDGPAAELLPLAYEDYEHTQHAPAEFAALLRTCALLHVEWARSVETQHASPSHSAASSSPPSLLASPWGTAGAGHAASASSSVGRPPSLVVAQPPPFPPPPPLTAPSPRQPPTTPPYASPHHVPTGAAAQQAPPRRARSVNPGEAPAFRHPSATAAERTEGWGSAVSPAGEWLSPRLQRTSAPALKLEPASPAAAVAVAATSHAFHRHHHTPNELPLPSRTLFVKLIHNFDAPSYLQRSDADPSATPSSAGPGAATTKALNPPASCSPLQITTPGTSTATAVPAAASRPLGAAVAHHHHHHHHHHHIVLHNTVPPPRRGSTLEGPGGIVEDRPAYTTPVTPLGVAHSQGHDGLAGVPAVAAPTAEDQAFFLLAQSVLQEAYFSERFAGFEQYREFLRPPFYGGCFVLFERGEDMQRCLQWMRRDERLMQIFSVAPARSDSFGT